MSGDKSEIYENALVQIQGIIQGESNLIANLGNICSILHSSLDFWWTGFYTVDGNELVLAPFQGPPACSRIAFGKGVCGIAWQKQTTQTVKDVSQFPGYISCDAETKSEIVTPVIKNSEVKMVLDIDSEKLNYFDEVDRKYLEELCQYIAEKVL